MLASATLNLLDADADDLLKDDDEDDLLKGDGSDSAILNMLDDDL